MFPSRNIKVKRRMTIKYPKLKSVECGSGIVVVRGLYHHVYVQRMCTRDHMINESVIVSGRCVTCRM